MFTSRWQASTVNLIIIQAKVHFMNEQSGIDGFEFQCLKKTDQMERETAVYFMIAIYRKHADILVSSSHKTHRMAWEDMKHSAQVKWTALMVLLFGILWSFCFWILTVPRGFMARAACKIWNIWSTSKSRQNFFFFLLFLGFNSVYPIVFFWQWCWRSIFAPVWILEKQTKALFRL